MSAKAMDGTIVTRIQKLPCSFENTRLASTNSSLLSGFNWNEGPGAAIRDAVPDRPVPSSPSPPQSKTLAIPGQERLLLAARRHCRRVPPLDAVESLGPPRADGRASGSHYGDEHHAVAIEILGIPNRRGRSRHAEIYPFSMIKVARHVDGCLEGESFFIPENQHPKRHITVARKRYGPGKTFETRTVPGGVRIWRKS